MAAIAACRAYGMTRERIASAMTGFRSDWHNPGRTNLYQVAGGYVMVDYGHNPDSFEAVCRMTSRWKGRKVTGIIGVPGDRDNRVVEQAARVAARGFNRLIVKEDKDLRGRMRGEIANLMYRAIREESPDRECQIVLDECESLAKAIAEMDSGEVVVMFYEKLKPVMEVLKRFDAVSVSSLEGQNRKFSVAKM
jgi:cyanophycin synthetase